MIADAVGLFTALDDDEDSLAATSRCGTVVRLGLLHEILAHQCGRERVHGSIQIAVKLI